MIITPKYYHLLQLLLTYLLLLISGYFILRSLNYPLSLATFASLLTVMTSITLAVYLLIMTGMKKDERSRGIYLLIGIGGKFLAYLILILIYWIPSKNLSKEFIIAFFVLYLWLTFFLIRILFKVLKSN